MKDDVTKNAEDVVQRLKQSTKPRIIAGKFENILDLRDEHLKHFGSNDIKYLWKMQLHDKDDEYKGMHMGLLLDETLNYIHMVFVSPDVLNYILKL